MAACLDLLTGCAMVVPFVERLRWPTLTACALLFAGGSHVAHASTTTPFYGARSLSMGGAHRGLAAGNDALFVNQAGMALQRRYSAEVQYVTGGDHVSRLMATTVDSKTAAVAAGVGYARTWGNPSGERPGLNQVNAALAWAPLPMLAVGLGAMNVAGHYRHEGRELQVSHFNGSLSTMVSLADMLGVGLTWENFVPVGKAAALTPRGLGVGAGLHASIFSLAADMRFDMRKRRRGPRSVDVGGEVVLMRFLALRGGWRLVPDAFATDVARRNVFTAGLAAMLGTGGLEVGMEKGLHDRGWRMAVGLQFVM